MNDDDALFDYMVLDAYGNLTDLLGSVADSFRETADDTGLYGIISEEDGGIIAYAIGGEHAVQIKNALNATFPKKVMA